VNLYDYCGSGRVLVVDDDAAVRELLMSRLTVLGYQVGIARDGEHALERVEDFRPNAMILDIAMPKLDGFGVLQRLGRDKLASMPVLILTGSTTHAQTQQAIQLGAKDFMNKPFNEMQLFRRVSRLFATMPGGKPQARFAS
jgi:two-component system OmpR family response regulator